MCTEFESSLSTVFLLLCFLSFAFFNEAFVPQLDTNVQKVDYSNCVTVLVALGSCEFRDP